ncbi:sigma-70 family RNA polymerase sigma factor [Rhizobium leguminosarum]|uniref:sigma-70 family RNA polymerase sigma factor n=1 Tax=Rhizobium leguminosarum TaxID=384 RepID=UPI002E0F8102|nr:sigma-70 family RNA polymerase sigma factor [Rhizobium leguminosarum]
MILSRTAALAEPILSKVQQRDLISRWQAVNDPVALEKMTRAFYRVSYHIASYYTKNPAHQEELAQEGTFGIRVALDKYDFSFNTKFSTFSRQYVQNAIAAEVSRVTGTLSMPSRVMLDARAGRTTPESRPQAFAAIGTPVSFDLPLGGDTGLPLSETFADAAPNPEDIAISESQQGYFRSLVAESLAILDERERAIVRRRHLIDPPDTLDMIGRDVGVTRERVRQIEAASMRKIRKHLTKKLGGGESLFDNS